MANIHSTAWLEPGHRCQICAVQGSLQSYKSNCHGWLSYLLDEYVPSFSTSTQQWNPFHLTSFQAVEDHPSIHKVCKAKWVLPQSLHQWWCDIHCRMGGACKEHTSTQGNTCWAIYSSTHQVYYKNLVSTHLHDNHSMLHATDEFWRTWSTHTNC